MAMKYTQIPADAWKHIQLNAGILLSDFDPATGTFEADNILGATSGGNTFEATPTYTDFGEDIDNCPKNTKELKQLESWEAKMSGTYVTVGTDTAKSLMAAADYDKNTNKITPRNELAQTDFEDIWWVGDYSNVNSGDDAGFCAIRLINALSTGGFKIQSGDKTKGTVEYEYTGHYSIEAPDTVPYEVYIKQGEAAATSATQNAGE